MAVDTSAILKPQLNRLGYAFEISSTRPGTIHEHCHQGIELLFVQRGLVEVSMNGSVFYLTPGQLVLHPGHIPHSSRALSGRFQRFTLYVHPEVAAHPATRRFLKEIHAAEKPMVLAPPPSLSAPVFRQITQLNSDTLAKTIVADILDRIAQNDFLAGTPIIDENLRLIIQVLSYMHHHSHSNENLNEIAARFYISASRLRSIFSQCIGYSPRQCRLELQIQKACALLARQVEIDAVASAAGFETRRGLERAFLRLLGLSPAKYRLVVSSGHYSPQLNKNLLTGR
ncbi:MAG TPA: AraC family transcriptional regulator [Firmicutes bacterium]|nr:AraC family transcriptional regulator [Bacillota bacterium]